MAKSTKAFDLIIKLSLPKEVEKQAIKIYDAFPSSIKAWRGVNSKVYLCVTEAYRTCGLTFDAESIQAELKINNTKKKNIVKNAAREGYNLVLHRYMPHDFVEEYCGIIGIRNDYFEDIYSYIDIILEHDPLLEEKSPESVAAGVIAYYAQTNGYVYDKTEYCKAVKKSNNDVSLIEKKMSIAHNRH